MTIVSADIKDMLEADSSLGLVFATNLFIGKEPTTPYDCVTIFDTYGFPPQRTLDNSFYEFPSIQIRVRDTKYNEGMLLIQDIRDSLHGRAQETWNGILYSSIFCSSGPALLDWDDVGNARFVVNFDLQRRLI